MNKSIIRVCEIALSALTELQIQENQKKNEKSHEELIRNNQQAVAINIIATEYNRKFEALEHRKIEVKNLMDLAYSKNIRLGD